MKTCKSVGIKSEAARFGVEPVFVAERGYGDEYMALWRVGNCEMIETNGDPICESDESFAVERAKFE